MSRKIFFRKKGFPPWDVVAAAYLIDETLFEKNPVAFSVRTEGIRSGSIFAFRNLADFTGTDNVVPINMPRTFNVYKFMGIFINRLLKL
jgi:inosine-uridine nucleoside N-ribohydrolase